MLRATRTKGPTNIKRTPVLFLPINKSPLNVRSLTLTVVVPLDTSEVQQIFDSRNGKFWVEEQYKNEM